MVVVTGCETTTETEGADGGSTADAGEDGAMQHLERISSLEEQRLEAMSRLQAEFERRRKELELEYEVRARAHPRPRREAKRARPPR